MRIGIDARLFDQTGVGRYITNLIKNLQEIDYKNDYVLFVKNEDYENVKFQISSRQQRDKFQIRRRLRPFIPYAPEFLG